jgi:hypothetical protein
MKLDILMHYDINESTGEITFIGKEEITVDTAVKAVKKSAMKVAKVDESTEPLIKLDPNKLILTTGAVQMLNVCADCRIDIKYKKKDKASIPVIGSNEAFGVSGGNKLTKTNTISFRGAANAKLAEFGTIFKLEPSEDEGIFYLIGDKPAITSDDEIDINSELDIDSLEDIDLENTKDLDGFNFTL